jgi:hypothetical protein
MFEMVLAFNFFLMWSAFQSSQQRSIGVSPPMCCQARHWCESRHQTAYRSATCLPTAKLQAACWTAPLAAGHNQAADLLYSSGEGLIQHGKVKHFGLSESEDCSIPGTTKSP